MWAAGVAACAAVVAWWRIVGPGFGWLSAFVVLLFGVPAAAVGGGPWAWTGVALAAAGFGLARHHRLSAGALAVSAAAFGAAATFDSEVLAVATGALALGGITAEMILGHWYLVDPRLPRWALRRLDAAAALGLALDAGVLVALGALGWQEADAVLGWAFVALTAMSAVLIVAVWFALREPRYSGVMAATGLSYLAVLTVFGAAVSGRIVVS